MNSIKKIPLEAKKNKSTKKPNNKDRSGWVEIEKSIDYLVRTDRSNLSWRELLGRPHECNNR